MIIVMMNKGPFFGALGLALLTLAMLLAAQQRTRHMVVHAGRLLDVKTG